MTYIPEPDMLAKRHEKEILGAVAVSLSVDVSHLQLMPEESFADIEHRTCGFLVLGPHGLIGVHAKMDDDAKPMQFSCMKV